MTWVDRIAGCLVVALAITQPSGNLRAHDRLEAQVQEVGEAIEDAGDDVADWILRLFRGVDDSTKKQKPSRQGGKGKDGDGGGQPTGGGGRSGGGGDDGGDDGGGDDGGGDDGGDDD